MCRKWNGDKIVTAVVLIGWFLAVAIPASIHSRIISEKQNAKMREEAIFQKDKHMLTETVMRAYEAVRYGNTSTFEEVVDIDSILLGLKKDCPNLSKEDILLAIKDKRFSDASTQYGVKFFRWVLADNEREKSGFISFAKDADGKYLNAWRKNGYTVEVTLQAHGYKKNTCSLRLEKQNGIFRIVHFSSGIINDKEKLNLLNRSEEWDAAELKAANTIKWNFGEPSWIFPMKGVQACTIPVEIEAIGRNLKIVTFAAQIVETSTGEVVDKFQIYASHPAGTFVVGKKIFAVGTMKIDPEVVPMMSDGRMFIGRIVPVDAVYEGSAWEEILFSKALGGL